MYRRLGMALAISGLLVSMMPTTVAAATWTLNAGVNGSCITNQAWSTVSWTGGHGHWITYRLRGTLSIVGDQVIDTYDQIFSKVDTGPGHADTVNMFDWNGVDVSGKTIRWQIFATLLRGGKQKPIGSSPVVTQQCVYSAT